MSHSIKIKNNQRHTIIGFEFSAFDSVKASLFYRVFSAEKYNNGVSGSGEEVLYSRHSLCESLDICESLRGLPVSSYKPDCKDEKRKLFTNVLGINLPDSEPIDESEIRIFIGDIREFIQTALDSKEKLFIIDFS